VFVPKGFTMCDIGPRHPSEKARPASAPPPIPVKEAQGPDTALIAGHRREKQARSLEGYLFPDTYEFSPHDDPATIRYGRPPWFKQFTPGSAHQIISPGATSQEGH